MRRNVRVRFLTLLFAGPALAGGLSGCLGMEKLPGAVAVEGASGVLDFSSAQNCGSMGYQKMLHTVLRPRCASCHGDQGDQAPRFAVSDFADAHAAGKTAAATLLEQATNGHGGCTACDLTLEDPLYQDLAQWTQQVTCPDGMGKAPPGASGGAPSAQVAGAPSPLAPGDYRVDLSKLSSGYVNAAVTFQVAVFGGGWRISNLAIAPGPVPMILTEPRIEIGGTERALSAGELNVDLAGNEDPNLSGLSLVWLSGSSPPVFRVDNIRSQPLQPGDGPRAAYVEAANRNRTPEQSMAYFNANVRPIMQASTCSNCHGAGDPVMNAASAWVLLATGDARNDNVLFNNPRAASGEPHPSKPCASDVASPCGAIANWWDYEFVE